MADSNLKFRQTTSGAHGSAGRADCLPRRKPPACIGVRQLCRKKIRCWGLGALTLAGEWDLVSHGFLVNFGARRFPKGERKALWCARRRIPLAGGLTRRLRRGSGTCRPMGRSHFSFDGERKMCKRKPAARRLQRRPAPLRVAGFGLREPFGLSSASVRFAHPPGKRLLLPILAAGLVMSRAA